VIKSVPDESDPQLKHVFFGLVFLWSAVILALAAWNYRQTYAATLEDARSSASESFRKDVVYRSWASMHGGVYAPVTPETPPNPYLFDIPERDITTPSGRKLTLINPAYMTRQVHELGNKDSGSKGHITSMKPLRPGNAPDQWEARALQAFERGVKEASSIEPLGGETYFRFMRPLTVEPGCLNCHAKQGYKVGDIRGGISASIPWAPYSASLRSQVSANLAGYGGIWALGFLGLRLGRKRLQLQLTERKHVEDALRGSEVRLRGLVEQLGSNNAELKLLNDKLAQSQGQLLQSEKMAAVGQLAAGVAHEINNPIGFVNSNLGTLKDYVERLLVLVDNYERSAIASSAAQSAELQAARKEADLAFLRDDVVALLAESRDGLERVKKIVQDLRDFSRIDSTEWNEADLNAGLESTLNVVRNELKYKAEVVKNLGDLPPVRCHLGQINQVFMNLLVNAAQAIEERGTINLASGADGPWAWVSVEDTGKGMTPEVLKRIFEPFFTTKPVGKGTGLGLSLAYDIVKKHGGRIEVQSEPGQGTRFQVWLPVAGPEIPKS
jgi:two-component system NtrC family sensor kinase